MPLRPSDQCQYGQVNPSGTTESAVLAAPGAGLGYRLMSLHLTTTDPTVNVVTLRNGISGATFLNVTVIAAGAAPTLGYRDLIFPAGGFRLGANQALMASISANALVTVGASAIIESRI